MTTSESHSTIETLEEDALVAGEAAADTLNAVEIAAFVLLGLLVCPPLAILVVVVVVPLAAIALVVALVAAVLTVPYVIVQRLRGHHAGHASVAAHRLRVAGRALLDLAPHRIHAAARKSHA
jgi:hypothetical protein